ncbi:MAG: dihydrolipoyllysine-residue succinyltransferase [Phycisphaerae bacterium]|nr:dihydrolipoyllysine-residue succinyltransferase [Phycisphaerae bacterium]MBM91531.1 dihydrolipoyllysine-residue succinyltransferase [Phycisphaerae bacterium]
MATQIVIPNVGESVTSGIISTWTVEDGAYVERDETVLELETDKVTMEVPAPASGIVKHGASEGDEVDVGATVGEIDESAEKPAGGGDGDATPEPEASAPAPKAEATPAPAPAAASAPAPAAAVATAPAAPASNSEAKATPLARKLADDQGVDLKQISGTGAAGRIREQDVLAWIQTHQNGAAGATAAPASAGVVREAKQERMSPMRQAIASRLVEAQQTAAMLTTFNEVDMGAVMDLRKQHKEKFGEKHGVNLGFMSFFVKATTQALQKFPLINAYITQGDNGKPAIEHHNYNDVAIAVSGPKGLVVPVLRNAEQMTFAEIEKNIKDMALRARDGKITLEEMQGGTFTITNGGIFGSLMSTPILNPPQSAILGMHGIKKRAIEYPAGSGQIALRPMMYLAVSYDHRIVDGAEAVQFLVSIKDAIEDPARLMLDL